ncbi:Nop52-domain-containing protein [Artomyces pyxidatus]|uniref:Nop52-domain-containing protein n=1 Tax=Artomyces pyxidatus TaxID=48021 RepID=A0ACB8TI70_9AGAM|nr:Nop52-domain-containing protein [Artomyces pyxidatus]
MASPSTSTSAVPPLGKYLASTDKKTRDKAIKSLSAFLSDPDRAALSENDMTKLWKGIFYCFWMSDKPLVQQALASELANLILTIDSNPSSLAFLRGFWRMTVREWNGIDRLRIDKYYMLVRRFVNASFRLLLRAEWDTSIFQEYNDILTMKGGPLCPDDNRVPLSLGYHLADIYLEELDKVLAGGAKDEDRELPLPAPLDIILSPFLALAARTPSKDAYERVKEAILSPLITSLTPPRTEELHAPKRRRLFDNDYPSMVANSCISDMQPPGTADRAIIRQAILKKIFSVASESETRDSNRRKLYAFWKSHVEEDEEEERPVDAS